MTRLITIGSAGLFLLPLVASCTDDIDGSTDDPTLEEAPDGLDLTSNTDTRVAGRFTKDGTTIAFDLERIDDYMHVVVTSADGTPLIDSDVLRGGSHTTRMLGGRLVVDGDATELPRYTGDREVERMLHDMPEGGLIHALEPTLAAARVKPEMIPTEHVRGGTLTAVGYGNCNTSVPDDGYATCGSWFLGWTSIYVQNCTPYYTSYVITSGMDGQAAAPAFGWQNLGPGSPPWYCARADHSGWWWGWNVTYKWGDHYYWSSWTPTHVSGQSNYFGH